MSENEPTPGPWLTSDSSGDYQLHFEIPKQIRVCEKDDEAEDCCEATCPENNFAPDTCTMLYTLWDSDGMQEFASDDWDAYKTGIRLEPNSNPVPLRVVLAADVHETHEPVQDPGQEAE